MSDIMRKKKVFLFNENYLCFTLKVLSFLGIWNPWQMEKGRKYWLYQAFTVYYIAVIMFIRIMTVFGRVLNTTNYSEFSQEVSLLVVLICDAAKGLTFLFHRKDVLEILDILNWERYLLGTPQISHFRNKTITNAMKASKLFTIAVAFFLTQYFMLYFWTINNYSDHKIENLPIGSPPIKYFFLLYNYWLAIICDFLTFTSLGLNAVCHDAFLMGVMINLSAQVEILNFRVENSHKREVTVMTAEQINEAMSITYYECIERDFDEHTRLQPNIELISCIRHHQQLLKILAIFKHIYNKVLLPQLSISLVLIIVCGLEMMMNDLGALDATLVALGFLLSAVLQLFAFCWGGNIILAQSDTTSFAVYSSQWYTMDKTYRTNLMIFVSLTRNPMIVSAGGLFDLSAVTFKNILTKGYSGIAVLQNMNG